ncbi:hypothetical protein GCM10012275_38750 [Longimycelium tulufanense]|uniref:Conserved hypothetical protein CHP02679 N terminus domain-containing protein n=1 Tax=Longimycelium tulufanense TaxID=907463 RepID=A0A8J3CAB3_9PSEU|nr:TIGR02679 domain-containing protein [Longimycelium tulufanense]GGM64408.1 hypothetical protein GCM10012275_38750 [Longimycelium tulufanense]
MASGTAPDPDRPELAELWRLARQAVESERSAFRLEVPDAATAEALGAVLGRPLRHPGRVSLSLRVLRDRLARFDLDLDRVLRSVPGGAVAGAAGQDEGRRFVEQVLSAALAGEGFVGVPWAAAWIDTVARDGRVVPALFPALARRAAAILAALHLEPGSPPGRMLDRAELAASVAGSAHALDGDQLLARLVLQAAALAHGCPFPRSDAERAALWRRCGARGSTP